MKRRSRDEVEAKRIARKEHATNIISPPSYTSKHNQVFLILS